MKILLVNPLWTKRGILPTNLAELAGYVRHYGFTDVEILDLNRELRDEQDIDCFVPRSIKLIDERNPDVLAVRRNATKVQQAYCIVIVQPDSSLKRGVSVDRDNVRRKRRLR